MPLPLDARKPRWLLRPLPKGEKVERLRALVHEEGLHTVCQEARCPNLGECWSEGEATLMIGGDVCTRGCRFCHVASGKLGPLDPLEPEKVARTVATMGLSYCVVTSVDRDDLPDQGAAHVAACVRAVKAAHPHVLVELLIGDFRGDRALLEQVVDSGPDVLAHNVETVRRLTPTVRDRRAGYGQSLEVLAFAKERHPRRPTKSSLMVGLGETADEVAAAMDDLRAVGVEFLTIGQYLQPTDRHLQVSAFVPPETFDAYRQLGESKGFKYVASGPLVRSSYKAGEYYIRSHIESAQVAT